MEEFKLNKKLQDVLDKNEISIIGEYYDDENDSVSLDLHFNSNAGEDFVFCLSNIRDDSDFINEFKCYADNIDCQAYASMWVESIEIPINDTKAIKEFLQNVSCELFGEERDKDNLAVEITLSKDELNTLAALSNIDDSHNAEAIAKAIHGLIGQFQSDKSQQNKENEEEIKEWLHNALSELTDGEMTITIESNRYDEFLSSNTLLLAFNEYQELVLNNVNDYYPTFRDYLENVVCNDDLYDAINCEEDYLYSKLIAKAESESSEIKEFCENFVESNGMYALLSEIGYEGIKVNLDSLLSNDYHINLMFATEQEQNFDMSSISSSFLYHDDIGKSLLETSKEFEETTDNALTYLIHQQGYKLSDAYKSYYAGKESKSKFIESVVDEINNTSYSMNELTVLTTSSGAELLDLLDNIAHSRDYLCFSKETEIGLFNEWQGAGSALEIQLEKPFVIPASMVRNLQFDCSGRDDFINKKSNYGYTVDDVYGLIGSVWTQGNVSITKEEPQLTKEDMKDTQTRIKNHIVHEKENKQPKVPERE